MIRILHCPAAVAGHSSQLARSEREIGLNSWSISFSQNYLHYETDELLSNNLLTMEVKRWGVLKRALYDFDVIHFNFGRSISPQWLPKVVARNPLLALLRWMYNLYAAPLELREIPLLKNAGKGIVVTYQGDDARQGDFCQKNFAISPANEVEPGYYSTDWDAHKRYRIAIFAKYADRIYALNPDLLHVLPQHAQFLPYAHVDLKKWQMIAKASSEIPVVLHAPTNRGVKGTRFVLDAVSRLQEEGIPFEFRMVEGLSHNESRRLYQQADLLVDQLLVGWYGGLAVELMALGKPVICYIRDGDLKFIPDEMGKDLPIIRATPLTIYDVLKEWLILRKSELLDVGYRSRAYVEKWHDPIRIANRLKVEYETIVSGKTI